MWFASAKPPYGTLDAAEWAPSTASKADICSAKSHVRFIPECGLAVYSLAFDLNQREYDFVCAFLASFGARYICADARPNWNKGEALTLCARVRPLALSIRQTDYETEHRKCLRCCRSLHAQAREIALSVKSIH